jgi:hypothetical protein
MRKLLMPLALLSSAASAAATDWRIINWNDEILLYVDHGSIQKTNSLASYSAKIVFLKDDTLAEVMSRVQVRCNEKMYRNMSVASVSKAGRTDEQKASGTWRAVVSGTNVEREMQSVCN